MSNDTININSKVQRLNESPQLSGVSKVILNTGDNSSVSFGNDNGRTLEMDNPFGTREMAGHIRTLTKLDTYQPYEANGVLLNPAAEIGDAVSFLNLYSGLYKRRTKFGRLMKADISAPQEEQIDHEYKYESPSERKYKRETAELKASLSITAEGITANAQAISKTQEDVTNLEITAQGIQANVSSLQGDLTESKKELSSSIEQTARDITANVKSVSDNLDGFKTQTESNFQLRDNSINAKVSQTGGNNSSFGWSLLANEFALYSNSKKVFSVTQDGASVDGEIKATKGTIGGFKIGTSALQYNNLPWEDNNNIDRGVYIGSNGIKLGKSFKVTNTGAVTATNLVINGGSISIGDNFRVDSSGNVTANNMKLTGTLTIGGNTITAANLYQGAYQAANNYGNWSDAYTSACTLDGYCYRGAGGGYAFTNATNKSSGSYPTFFRCKQFLLEQAFQFGSYGVSWQEMTVLDKYGVPQKIYYLGR